MHSFAKSIIFATNIGQMSYRTEENQTYHTTNTYSKMKRIYKNFLMVVALALPSIVMAQYGNTPPLHVDGNQLKDPHGNTVVLHGVMDTPNPYFNSYRWGSSCTSSTITPCINYFNKLFTAMTDTASGAYCNLFRLHLDPCWTNDPSKSVTGEDDISAFSSTRLRTYLRSLYFRIAKNAINHGLYVIMRPPGVFPATVQVGDEYNEYLTTVWDIVSSNDSIKKYSGQISLELGNEPVTVLNADGEEDVNALHDFFQPIVDKIRANGFTGIIWVPGTGWQSNYANYAYVPIEGYNIGYAVHNYVGWYGADDTKTLADSTTYINTFHNSVPVVDTNPIVITEVDWSPEQEGTGHYNEHGEYVLSNYGTWATGSTSHWGNLYKALLDHFGNISMTLSGTACYLDIDEYINNGNVVPAFQGVEEACGETCFDWYKEYAQVNEPHPDFTRKYTSDTGMGTFVNPLINADFPDPDIILVGDTYYLATTTMHNFPGVTILKSKDLVNWEYCANPLLKISDEDPYNLANGKNAYAGGQWAPSLSYHNGKFIVNFIAFGHDGYDDGGDWILTATDPEGTWEMTKLEGFYYDSGFLFDDNRDHLHGLAADGTENGDGYLYVAAGIGNITVSQLNASTFKEIKSQQVLSVGNGLEGSHMYHIGDYYYIYATYGGTEGSQTIFRSTSPFGPYEEHDGRIFANQHIHQGGLVETQTGEWWTILFKDAGAIGRIPYLEPVTWADGWPTLGNSGTDVSKNGAKYKKPDVGNTYPKTYLPTNDTFTDPTLGLQWEWNHNPDDTAWSLLESPGNLRLHTASVTDSLNGARNMLTQRIFGYNPEGTASGSYTDSYGTISLDTYGMQDGDVAGLAIFQDPYAYIGVKVVNGKKYFVQYRSSYDTTSPVEVTGDEVTADRIYLRAVANFGTSKANFYYSYDNETWTKFGNEMDMRYTLKVFVGNRFGIFNYATRSLGGYVDIDWFSTEPVFTEDRYYGTGVLKTYTKEDLTLETLSIDADSYTITPGSTKTIGVTATYQSGLTANVAASCTYTVSNPNVITIVGGSIKGLLEGTSDVTATYTDINGATQSVSFSVTVSYFPLTADGINPSIYGTGSFNERTGALTTSQYGFGGWEYGAGIDLSGYNYIVVELRRGASCSPSFRLYDANNYWSTAYAVDMGTQKSITVDLHNMTKEDGTTCDPSHLYLIGFWSYGGSAIYIKNVYLSNDGTTPVGILDITTGSVVQKRDYYTPDGRRQSALQRGINIVRSTHADGTVTTEKVLMR